MTTAEESLKTLYSQGIKDGMEVVLSLLLGLEASGGVPFTGPLSPEVQNWAVNALGGLRASREG